MRITECFRRGGVGTRSYLLAILTTALFAAHSAFCAGELTLNVGATSVDVVAPAGVLDETSELYLVWDGADRGETLSAWSSATRAQYSGTIDGTARTYTFDVAIPAGKAVRAIATTGVKILSDGAYITQPAGLYFNTGILDTAAYGMEIQIRPISSENWAAYVGSGWENFNIGCRGGFGDKRFYVRHRTNLYGYNENIYTASMTTDKHVFSVKDNAIKLDGVSYKSISTSSALGTKGVTILLGKSWDGNGTALYGTSASAAWYQVVLFDSAGAEMAHLVPAIYQGKAAFYDTVRETVILPAGSGTASASTSSYSEIIANYAQFCSDAYLTGMTATWRTGGGDRTNVNDPANWECVDGAGETVSGAIPDAVTTINISGSTDFQVPAGQTLTFGVLNIGDCTLTADCDWRGLGSAAIAGTITLGGHTLKLADTKGAGTITGAGKLVIEVAEGNTVEGNTVTNDSLTLTGLLQLEKTGEGTFVAAKAGQTYTGGTVVSAGIAKSGAFNGAWGPSKANITIASGAAFDWDGKVNATTTTPYSFNIAGAGPDGNGAMYSSQLANDSGWYGHNSIADMTLDGDTIIKMPADPNNTCTPGFVYSDATQHILTLGGHTLTIRDGNRVCMRNVRTVGAGKIQIVYFDKTKNSHLRQLSFYGNNYNGAGEGSDLRSATLEIGLDCGINAEATFPVGTLIDRRTARKGTGVTLDGATNRITVVERYQPTAATSPLHTITLGDAEHLSPVLDVSELSEAFNLPGDYTFMLQSGATISVDTGSRELCSGLKLLSWTAEPSNDFTLYDPDGELGYEAVKLADGLYANRAGVPAYATIDLSGETPVWRYFAADGEPWTSWGGGITSEIQVRFSSYDEYAAIKEAGVSPREYLLTGSLALPAGEGTVDMSGGFAFAADSGATIDVAGRTLKLPASIYGQASAPAVKSSVEGGALEVDVASGITLENTAVELKGSLKLVKKGAGTFVAAKAGQTYTGGTLVSAGIAKSGAYNGAWGAAKSLVTVADGASFDWAGKVNDSTTTPYSFNICGSGIDGKGAIYSSALIGGESGFHRWNIIADLTLSGDATISTYPHNNSVSGREQWTGDGLSYDNNETSAHVLALGTHTLTIQSGGRFAFRNVSATGSGSVLLRALDGSDGYRQISVYNAAADLSTIGFDIGDGAGLNMEEDMTVRDFTDRRTSRRLQPAGYEKNGGTIKVLGTFKPCHTQIFSKFALGDETHTTPTLDLGDITGAFDISGSDYTLTFASGSTVTVKLTGSRTDLKSLARTKDAGGEYAGYILRWGEGNTPSGVTFAVESGLSTKYRLETKDDGLVLRAKSGMVIVIK